MALAQLHPLCAWRSACLTAGAPWAAAHQSPPLMGPPSYKYWSGLRLPPPGDLPSLGIEPAAPALGGGFFTTQPPGKPACTLLSQALSCDNYIYIASPGGSDGKESARSAGDLGSTPGLGRSPGGGHGNPLQCLASVPWTEEPGGLWGPWGLKELDMTD